MKTFKDLGLSQITLDALNKKGFEHPTPIQAMTIPLLLKGNQDVLGQAQTGTGKTACFALPILEKIENTKETQALILAPTRELALQVATEMESLKGNRKFNIVSIYGGAPITKQMDELKRGAQIVVGTPGRMIDLINRGKLKINTIKFAVLDEADEMLNMGFLDDIEKILSQTNQDKRMLLFSATMPREILRIAKKFMKEHEVVKDESKSLATKLIDQVYYDIMGKDRYTALKRIVAITPDFHGLIFCKTRAEVDTVANKLIKDEYAAAAIHGEISQGQRENTLRQFRSKHINILIATDVAARGIDVNDLNIVINYSLPQSPETYVHRIGRTGRAGNKGKAITFLMPSEKNKLKFVEKIIKEKISKGKLPEIDDIIVAKKSHIETTIIDMLQNKTKSEYDAIASKLLSIGDAEHVVSTVLRYAFANQLSSNDYQEISEVSEKDINRAKSSSGRGGYGRGRSGGNRRGGDRRGGSRGGGDRRRSNGGSRDGGRDRRGSQGDKGGRGSREGFKSRDDKPRGDRRGGSRDRKSYDDKPRRGRDSDRKGGRNDKPHSGKPKGDRRDSGKSSFRKSDSKKPYGGSNSKPSGKKKDYSKKPRRNR